MVHYLNLWHNFQRNFDVMIFAKIKFAVFSFYMFCSVELNIVYQKNNFMTAKKLNKLTATAKNSERCHRLQDIANHKFLLHTFSSCAF